MKEKKFFVIVFQIGGTLFTEYRWAYSEAQFLRRIHCYMEMTRDEKYRNCSMRKFFRYKVADITKYWERNPQNNARVREIVEKMRREVGAMPIR